MSIESDNIGSQTPLKQVLGSEVFEVVSKAVAQIGGAPNGSLTVDQVVAYAAAALGVGVKPISTQAGAAYTAAIADAAKWTDFTNAGPVAFTIDANVAYPSDAEIEFSQSGAGFVTVAGANGAVIQSRGAVVTTAGQFATAMLKRKGATNNWLLTGDLA